MSAVNPLLPGLADRTADPVIVGLDAIAPRALLDGCRAHARELARRGVKPGDRVAVVMRQLVDAVIAVLGNALYGAVTVPLNPKLGDRERDHILRDAAPALVIDMRSRFVTATPDGELPVRAVDDAPLLVLYTSGTTGAPKGAVLTAGNVAANLDALADAWQWTADDMVVHALPMFHVHGLVLGLFGSLRTGGRLYWAKKCTPEHLGAAIGAGATMLFAVPTMYHRLADAAETHPTLCRWLAGMRLLVSGSAGLAEREHRRIERLTGRGVHERYGLTETLINCAVRADGPPRPGWVGPPLRGVELELRHDGDGELGEIYVRGPSVFAGYLNQGDAKDADGWFATGDLAVQADDGAIKIVGRKSTDLIKTGGYKVGAGEVEAALLEIEGVAEVAVIGAPDDDLGERIVAFVVARDGASLPPVEHMIQRVADELAPHKRPREVRVVAELPRNAMGKVQKKKLSELG